MSVGFLQINLDSFRSKYRRVLKLKKLHVYFLSNICTSEIFNTNNKCLFLLHNCLWVFKTHKNKPKKLMCDENLVLNEGVKDF